MLRIGVIGYGNRIRTVLERMGVFEIPYRVVAVADPRQQELRGCGDAWLDENAAWFPDAEAMVQAAPKLDGVMIGTRCFMHADNAVAAARLGAAVFLEKPVAITFDQVRRLADAYADYPAPVVVSFPLRVTRMARQVRQLIADDTIGRVDQVTAFNDVPYGRGYYTSWYREMSQSGGLWLQKATHDLDTLNFLLDDQPAGVFAMESLRNFGGDYSEEHRCSECSRTAECPESTFNLFYQQLRSPRPSGKGDRCVYSRQVQMHDSAHALVEYAGGAQASYSQNFFARHKAARRGARLSGYKGSIDFDFYANRIQVFSHRSPTVQTIEYPYFEHHWGGDRELCHDWLMAMRDGAPSRCPMSTGIASALVCLWARESAATRKFCQVEMPAAADAEAAR